MKPDCLVTGGAGFIGSHIVRALLRRGHAVRVLDNFSTGCRENLGGIAERMELVEGDLRDKETRQAAVRGMRWVFHVGALPSVVRSIEDPAATNAVNVCGTLGMLLAARDAGVDRFVFSSSASVYGDLKVLPTREDLIPLPQSPYAVSKLAGEHYCRIFHELHGLKTFSLRYFNVFGPRQDPKSQYAAVVPLFIEALRRNQAPVIYGDGEQTRDFTYVTDVVSANLLCCEAPERAAGGVFNVARGDRISVNSLFQTLAALLVSAVKPVFEPPRPGDVRDSQADSSLAQSGLGWMPSVSFEEGLRRTLAWFADPKAEP